MFADASNFSKLVDEEEYAKVITAYEAIFRDSPGSYEARFYFALSLLKTGRLEESLREWKALLKLGANRKNVYLNIGCVYHEQKKIPLAIRYYRKELSINPTSGEALYNLGALYYARHQYYRAVSYLEKCYYMRHSQEAIVDRLADSYFHVGEITKEIDLYENWLDTHPNDPWALNNLGAALMQLGEYARGELKLTRAHALDSTDPLVNRNLKKVKGLRKARREKLRQNSVNGGEP